jgi:hypothetical protein
MSNDQIRERDRDYPKNPPHSTPPTHSTTSSSTSSRPPRDDTHRYEDYKSSHRNDDRYRTDLKTRPRHDERNYRDDRRDGDRDRDYDHDRDRDRDRDRSRSRHRDDNDGRKESSRYDDRHRDEYDKTSPRGRRDDNRDDKRDYKSDDKYDRKGDKYVQRDDRKDYKYDRRDDKYDKYDRRDDKYDKRDDRYDKYDRKDDRKDSKKINKKDDKHDKHDIKLTKPTGYLLPIPIEIFGYSNLDNPFNTETLDKQFYWKKRDKQRYSLNLPIFNPTAQTLRDQAMLMRGLVMEVKMRRLENIRDRDMKQRLREQIQRDTELIASQDYELEQARNALLQVYKQCEIRCLKETESPLHIFVKYVLFKIKLISPDVFNHVGISSADSEVERQRHNHFVSSLLEIHRLFNIIETIDSLNFDELIYLYAGVSKMIDLTQKTLLFQAKQKQKAQNAKKNLSDPNASSNSIISSSPLDSIIIVTPGDLDFWVTLQYVLTRELDVKYLIKMGFSKLQSLSILMTSDKNTRLTFSKINARYKRFINPTVMGMMSRSEESLRRQTGGVGVTNDIDNSSKSAVQKPLSYLTLDGVTKLEEYCGDVTSGSSINVNKGNIGHKGMADDQYNDLLKEQVQIEQTLPVEWVLTSASFLPQSSVDDVYQKLHEGVLPLNEIRSLKDKIEEKLDGIMRDKNKQNISNEKTTIMIKNENNTSNTPIVNSAILDDAPLCEAILIEASFVEAKALLYTFYRRLLLIRGLQLKQFVDKTGGVDKYSKMAEKASNGVHDDSSDSDITPQTNDKNDSNQQQSLQSTILEPAEQLHGQYQPENDKLSKSLQVEFQHRDIDDSNEATITDIAIERFHSSKFITRKPRFISKVKTGLNWSKYNRTHYDRSNPPPKQVQGYRFEIFYPDLIDPYKDKPKFSVIHDPNDRDYCVLRFSSGPPYEDIAFKIVNKKWNQNYTKSFFAKGILTLTFNFSRVGYRR